MGEPVGNCAPRWEWRTFGARLPEIEAKLGHAINFGINEPPVLIGLLLGGLMV